MEKKSKIEASDDLTKDLIISLTMDKESWEPFDHSGIRYGDKPVAIRKGDTTLIATRYGVLVEDTGTLEVKELYSDKLAELITNISNAIINKAHFEIITGKDTNGLIYVKCTRCNSGKEIAIRDNIPLCPNCDNRPEPKQN